MTIVPVLAEIFGRICHFFHLVRKGTDFALVMSGVTGPIFIKFAKDVAKIGLLPLKVRESNRQYCNLFQNAGVLNEGQFANFSRNLVAMATVTSFEESEKEVRVDETQTHK